MISTELLKESRPRMDADVVLRPGLFPARGETLGLILPTLREAANIGQVLERVLSSLDSTGIEYEVIVVDDASGDGTSEIVGRMCAAYPQLRLVERVGERGLSGAILDGWSLSGASVLAVIDADMQHPPELLPRLWRAMEGGADLAVASRYAHGADTGRWRLLRRWVSSAAVVLCRPLQSPERMVSDPMSGFFMVRRAVVRQLPPLQRSGFKLLLEVLVRGRIRRVVEVPFSFGARHAGQSKASVAVLGDYLRLLIGLYWTRLSGGRAPRATAASTAERAPVVEPEPLP